MPVTLGDLFPFGDVEEDILRRVGERFPDLPIESAGPLIELGKAAVRLLEVMAATLDDVGLSPARWRLLVAAAFQAPPEGATVGELARHLGVREPTVSATIDRLVDEALVERSRDADDRRVVRVQITEHGRYTIARIAPMIGVRMAPIVEGLGGAARTREIAESINTAIDTPSQDGRSTQ